MRLIDADAYMEKVCTYKETGCGCCVHQSYCPVDEPTVETKEVVHGEWENVGDSEEDLCFRCSNCKEEFSCEIDMNTFANFCPHCGADMRTSAE